VIITIYMVVAFLSSQSPTLSGSGSLANSHYNFLLKEYLKKGVYSPEIPNTSSDIWRNI